MGGKVLFTASTYSHIVNFHLPYLRKFQEEGWTVHAACGGRSMPIPDVERYGLERVLPVVWARYDALVERETTKIEI